MRLAKWGGAFDLGVIDGAANLIARIAYAIGGWFRRFQTGFIRSYVLFLVLAALYEFARMGLTDAVLETDDDRLAAIKTYQNLGFQPEHR